MSDVFVNIDDKTYSPLPPSQNLSQIASMQVGEGSQVFRSDRSGIWLGAATFADAPFSVNMAGDVIATSATFSAYISKAGTGQSLTGDFDLGGTTSGYVKIDGDNKRILINDGTNNRIVIGDV